MLSADGGEEETHGTQLPFEGMEHESHAFERHRAEQRHVLLLPKHDRTHGTQPERKGIENVDAGATLWRRPLLSRARARIVATAA